MRTTDRRQLCRDLSIDDRIEFFSHCQKLGAKFYHRADNDCLEETVEVGNGQATYWIAVSIFDKAYKKTINGVGNGKKVCNTGLMRIGGVIKKGDQ